MNSRYLSSVVRLSVVCHLSVTFVRPTQCKIGGKLVLITNRNPYMSFRLVPKSVTLNDLERHNGRYIALFHWIWLQKTICGGIYARVYCILYCVYNVVVKKVHVRYLISRWVSCLILLFIFKQRILTRWPRRARYFVLCQFCLVTTYELTRASHNCGQRTLNQLNSASYLLS